MTKAQENQDPQAAWDKIAPGYEKTRRAYADTWVGNEGLHRGGLRPGMRFLDVAAGSGALSMPAARLGARVLATDVSPVMLDLLKKRARDEGLTIETRVMDGHALALDDNSFDMAGSQFGVMLFPDAPKGISEMARVVKPGGRVLMVVLGDPREVEFFAFFIRGIRSVRPDFAPPLDPPPLPFQLQDPERLRNELTRAGLKDVTIEPFTETLAFKTGKDLWTWVVWSNPVAEMVLGDLQISARRERGDPAGTGEDGPRACWRQRIGCLDRSDQHRHWNEVAARVPTSCSAPAGSSVGDLSSRRR